MGVKKWNQMLQQQQPLLPAEEQIPGTIFSYAVSFLEHKNCSSRHDARDGEKTLWAGGVSRFETGYPFVE
jgi:hypothetical protein